MSQSHPENDPFSAPLAPRRSGTGWSADAANVPRRPVGPAELRASDWQEIAPLDGVASMGPIDPVTEDTAPTVFPGAYSFDHLTHREDSTTDATAIPDDDMQEKLREQLRRMSESHVITLDDSDDEDASPTPAVHIVKSTRRSLRHTPDFRAMARENSVSVPEDAPGADSGLLWVVSGALAASALVVGTVWAFGLL